MGKTQMEFWDVLDKDRKPTGKKLMRGARMKEDEYHLVVDVWIQSSKGEFLISKRTENKTFPNLWETTGGSAVTGDDSLKTALKEVREELGLELVPVNGKLIFQCQRSEKQFPDFLYVWLFKQDFDISSVICQQDEVSEAKWSTKEQIIQMIGENIFFQYYNYLKYVFET